jgi:hypothetical protein
MEPDFTPPRDQSKPQHFWGHETTQYRVKIRPFSRVPAEFTIQRISFERDLEVANRAYENGYTNCTTKRGQRVKGDRPPDAESIERSQRRSKTTVRLLATELAPNALVTFTTREILTLDQLLECWQQFIRSMRFAGYEFEYVAVPERHPKNPVHLHLHAAVRGKTPIKIMRRFWHMALEARHGRRVKRTLYGIESPGNIDVQPIKSGSQIKRCRKIARYISKYITKDLIAEFNRRRYWPSKGINLADARVYWLDSLTMVDAIREACGMLGQWDSVADVPAQRLFYPSERVAWCAIDPDCTPPPPF